MHDKHHTIEYFQRRHAAELQGTGHVFQTSEFDVCAAFVAARSSVPKEDHFVHLAATLFPKVLSDFALLRSHD